MGGFVDILPANWIHFVAVDVSGEIYMEFFGFVQYDHFFSYFDLTIVPYYS